LQAWTTYVWLNVCLLYMCFANISPHQLIAFVLVFFSLLAVLGFELRASHLLDRLSSTWVRPLALFAVVIFRIGLHFYAWTSLDCDPSIYVSLIAWMTGVYHHVQLLLIDGGLENTSPSWSRTAVLPILASHIARITGMSHCTLCHFLFYFRQGLAV
jgi:hypothetical protein